MRECCYRARERLSPPCAECLSLMTSDLFNHDAGRGFDESAWELTGTPADVDIDPSQFFDREAGRSV